MKHTTPTARILHVDLDPFFVGVERARDASLRDRPLVIGGSGELGRVAAASNEARSAGVCAGMPMGLARRLCPDAVFRPGDFDSYARVCDETTRILTSISARVERPSVDEGFVDLATTALPRRRAVMAAESVRDAIQRRLGLDAAFGLASSRLAARIASRWARPRGFLLLLPEHEESFVRRQSLDVLTELPDHVRAGLVGHGLTTLAHIADATEETLRSLIGRLAADRLRADLDPRRELPIATLSPPDRGGRAMEQQYHLFPRRPVATTA